MELCFATANPNKIREIAAIVSDRFLIKPMSAYDFHDDIEETGATLEENSLIKAKAIFEKLDLPIISDDSGLEVNTLDGAPGVISARYAGLQRNDQDNIELLLKNLEGKSDRSARFRTVITLLTSTDSVQFEGIVEGEIIEKPRGKEGFGYDPIFIPNGHSKTFAELSPQEKNRLSHRAIAFEKLAHYLNAQ